MQRLLARKTHRTFHNFHIFQALVQLYESKSRDSRRRTLAHVLISQRSQFPPFGVLHVLNIRTPKG